MILMNYAEVCFLQAEAAARGWNMGKTAETLYNEGIRASMEYMEIDKTLSINTNIDPIKTTMEPA